MFLLVVHTICLLTVRITQENSLPLRVVEVDRDRDVRMKTSFDWTHPCCLFQLDTICLRKVSWHDERQIDCPDACNRRRHFHIYAGAGDVQFVSHSERTHRHKHTACQSCSHQLRRRKLFAFACIGAVCPISPHLFLTNSSTLLPFISITNLLIGCPILSSSNI